MANLHISTHEQHSCYKMTCIVMWNKLNQVFMLMILLLIVILKCMLQGHTVTVA